MADFNVNLDPDSQDIDPLNIELKDKLLDTFPLAGLKQTVEKCTRQVSEQRASLIDHSWISNINKHVAYLTLTIRLSHHF